MINRRQIFMQIRSFMKTARKLETSLYFILQTLYQVGGFIFYFYTICGLTYHSNHIAIFVYNNIVKQQIS